MDCMNVVFTVSRVLQISSKNLWRCTKLTLLEFKTNFAQTCGTVFFLECSVMFDGKKEKISSPTGMQNAFLL